MSRPCACACAWRRGATPRPFLACNINESYDDADRTSYGVRITVDPAAAGHNLGAELARYSSLIGVERGSRVRRAFVGMTNYSSVANILNHVGFVADQFYQDVPVHGARFGIALPLSPAGLMNNRVDIDKTRVFVATHEPDRDYLLVDWPHLPGSPGGLLHRGVAAHIRFQLG